MEIVPLVQDIKLMRCVEKFAFKDSVKSNVRYPVTKFSDDNMLAFERKKFCAREIREQPHYAVDVVFFNISNNKDIRQVNEIDGEPELDLYNMGLKFISCLRSVNISFLYKLNLSYNRLSCQFLDFDLPPLLKDLDLSYNQIESLPDSIGNSQLSKLNLSHNRLDTIPEDLPHSLLVLNISGNIVGEIKNNLPNSLIILNLSNNRIEKIPDTLLFSLKKLETLNLSDNILTDIPFIPEKHTLSSLDISKCNIDRSNLESLITRYQGLRIYI